MFDRIRNFWGSDSMIAAIFAIMIIGIPTLTVVAIDDSASAEQPLQVEFFNQGDDIDKLDAEMNEYLITVPPDCVQDIQYIASGRFGDNFSAMVVRRC